MIIRNLKNEEEIRYCIEIYYKVNDHSFLYVDKEYLFENLLAHTKKLGYFKVIEKTGIIRGWLVANETFTKNSRRKILRQEYYFSNFTGYTSAKTVMLLHRDLIEYAKLNKFHSVISEASHLDPTHVFTRILEKDGWVRRGHIAKYDLR
jgi:hypothetical protein